MGLEKHSCRKSQLDPVAYAKIWAPERAYGGTQAGQHGSCVDVKQGLPRMDVLVKVGNMNK